MTICVNQASNLRSVPSYAELESGLCRSPILIAGKELGLVSLTGISWAPAGYLAASRLQGIVRGWNAMDIRAHNPERMWQLPKPCDLLAVQPYLLASSQSAYFFYFL